MDRRLVAIVLGGVLPAVLLGLSGTFQKLGTRAGIGTGPFLVGAGLTTMLVGGAFLLLERDATATPRGLLFTLLFGLAWAVATGCIGLALGKFGAQISQLVPLYNMNTLVAVVIGLVALGEWKDVDAPRVGLASVLIVAGGILAARA